MHAAVIRRLGKRVIIDIIEIGRRLTEAKKIKRGSWEEWLKAEFGWTKQTSLNFERVYELSLSKNFLPDATIAPSALYLLVRPSTPKEVQDEVLDDAKAGKKISVNDVKAALKEAQEPEPESGSEPAPAEESNPTNNWRADLMRGLRGALTLAGECVEYGNQARAVLAPELQQQMREVFTPHRRAVSDARSKAQGLVEYLDLIQSITAPEAVAEAAE